MQHQPDTGYNELVIPADFRSEGGVGIVQLSAINKDSSLVDFDYFTAQDGGVLDGIPVGASRQVLFVAGLVPLLPDPPEPPEIGPKPPKKEEVIAWLQCAQVGAGDDVPDGCEGDGGESFDYDDFEDSSALGALQLYRALVRSPVTAQRIRPAFLAAIDSYGAQPGSDQVLGSEFRTFLFESTEHPAATDYLEQFSFLFTQLKLIDMLPNDYAALRDELLVEIQLELELMDSATLEGLGETFDPYDAKAEGGTAI